MGLEQAVTVVIKETVTGYSFHLIRIKRDERDFSLEGLHLYLKKVRIRSNDTVTVIRPMAIGHSGFV